MVIARRNIESRSLVDAKLESDKNKAGVSLWKEHDMKRRNNKLNQEKVEDGLEKLRSQFKQQHGEEFFDWAQKKGLLAATGMDTPLADDIIKEIEEK